MFIEDVIAPLSMKNNTFYSYLQVQFVPRSK
jgi:hypothetical protein